MLYVVYSPEHGYRRRDKPWDRTRILEKAAFWLTLRGAREACNENDDMVLGVEINLTASDLEKIS